jgi:hypothetical protein
MGKRKEKKIEGFPEAAACWLAVYRTGPYQNKESPPEKPANQIG